MRGTWLALLLCGVAAQTDLDAYVNAPDPHFGFFPTGQVINLIAAKAYVLNFTSQAWTTPDEISLRVWTHQLIVVVPDVWDQLNSAVLWITGDKNSDGASGNGPVKDDDEDLLLCAAIAIETSSIAVALKQVPNQPIVFEEDPKHSDRSEDELVGWTWYRYLHNTTDPRRLVIFPMVKAAVRALDAIEQYIQQQYAVTVNRFMLAGASKRGWTTWLAGAVAPPAKVIAITPMVLDLLNLDKILHHQFRSYNGWTWPFGPYWKLNVTTFLDTPQFLAIRQQMDPIFYKERLGMPKVVFSSSDDEFMQIDDANYWWGSLPGENHFVIATNSEHTLITGIPEIVETVCAFYDSVRKGSVRPKMDWVIDPANHVINVSVYSRPLSGQATLRHAATLSTELRDFRWVTQPPGGCRFPSFTVDGKCIQPILWWDQPINPMNGSSAPTKRLTSGTGANKPVVREFKAFRTVKETTDAIIQRHLATPPAEHKRRQAMALAATKAAGEATIPLFSYSVSMDAPLGGGWAGFFIDVAFPSDTGLEAKYRWTSQAVVVPNVFPFPDCHGEGCRGTLV